MNGKEWNSEDQRLFQKIKQDAINSDWVYTPELFKSDVLELREAIRKTFGIHDRIETRIHINTKQDSIKINDVFYAWDHVSDFIRKAYHSTQRDKL